MPAIAQAMPLPGELAANDRATILKPASPWHLEAAQDRCILSRTFSSDEGPGLVSFEQLAPGPTFDVTFAGPDFASERRGSWTYAGMRNDWPVITIQPIEFDLPGYGDAASLIGASIEKNEKRAEDGRSLENAAIDLAAAALSDRLVFQRSTQIVSFETGNMRAPFEALNACASELLEFWELDPADHQSYSRPVMPDARVYFARLNNDLLRSKKLTGDGALIKLRARIESDGTVAHCVFETMAAGQSNVPDICEDIAEMRFEPAKSKEGVAFASLFTLSVRLRPNGSWNAGAHGQRGGAP